MNVELAARRRQEKTGMDAANLRTFMARAGPVMEKAIEENSELYL